MSTAPAGFGVNRDLHETLGRMINDGEIGPNTARKILAVYATKPDAPPPQWNALRAAYRAALAVGVALAMLAGPARAAPPPVGSDDWNLMAPYREWVTTRHDAIGHWCCSIGDGRPVDAEIRGGHWWAHVDPKHWDGDVNQVAPPGPMTMAPEPLKDRWIEIPDERVTPGVNPTGSAILWLWQGRPQCFAPTGGV